MAAYEEIRCSACKNKAMAEKANIGVYTPSGWYQKKGYFFCSKGCQDRHNSANNSSSNSSENVNNPEVEAQKARTEEAKARAAEAKSEEKARVAEAKSQERASIWTGLLAGVTKDSTEVKETTDYISKIVFSNDPDEIENQLSEINSLWASGNKYTNSDHTKAVKKAAFEKFDFGMMKLKQLGNQSQIDFFEKKHKEMKPKKFFGLF
jgi:hypothetical protein